MSESPWKWLHSVMFYIRTESTARNQKVQAKFALKRKPFACEWLSRAKKRREKTEGKNTWEYNEIMKKWK